MSVFAGAVTLDAVEGVCDGHGLERLAILDVLTGLIDKSLVVVDDDGPAARYRLLETIRQYGDVRLAESGDKDRGARHRDYFLTLAEHIEPRLFGADQDQATTELLDAQPNLAAAARLEREPRRHRGHAPIVCATFYYFIVRAWSPKAERGPKRPSRPVTAIPPARRASSPVGSPIFGSDFTSAEPAAGRRWRSSPDEATRLRAEGLAAEGHRAWRPGGDTGLRGEPRGSAGAPRSLRLE